MFHFISTISSYFFQFFSKINVFLKISFNYIKQSSFCSVDHQSYNFRTLDSYRFFRSFISFFSSTKSFSHFFRVIEKSSFPVSSRKTLKTDTINLTQAHSLISFCLLPTFYVPIRVSASHQRLTFFPSNCVKKFRVTLS